MLSPHSTLQSPPAGYPNRSPKARILAGALLTLSLATSAFAQHTITGPVTKELAGPPSDFGWMQLPNPAARPSTSKLTLIPVTFQDDGTWSRQIHVDPETSLRLVVLGHDQNQWQVDLQTPRGQWLGEQAQWTAVDPSDLGLSASLQPPQSKTVESPNAEPSLTARSFTASSLVASETRGGSWLLTVEAPLGKTITDQTAGFVMVVNEGPWALNLWSSTLSTVVGQPIHLQAALRRDLDPLADGEESKLATPTDNALDFFVEQVQLTQAAADGSSRTWSRAAGNLNDVLTASAGHAKAHSESGLSFRVTPNTPGLHRFDLRLKAFDRQGQMIERSASLAIQVIEPAFALHPAELQLRVADPDPTKIAGSQERLQIDLPVDSLGSKSAGPAQAMVYAELWGTDDHGRSLPVAWIGGIKQTVETSRGAVLPLKLDSRWLAKAASQPPYVLKNLRLVDPESSVPYAQKSEVAVASAAPSHWLSHAKRLEVEPDEAMLFGPRPVELPNPAVGGAGKSTPRETIVLVHGYCSGNVWAPYQHQFAPPRQTFADFGQARSNNQFAVRLWWQTSGIDHFSTVSHSQGGMAALHLYNYYWSGLDTSLAPRPLQSVGTPFQGSALMLSRVALDAIIDLLNLDDRFCPAVNDLTYGGAGVWLAGIPSAARDKAYYYRTRGTLLPCHALTAPIIPGRDDGVVSLQEGVLPGGHDLGVKNAQCHTPDMFHSFQLADANRNVQMAANARIWIPDPIEACLNVTAGRPYAPAITVLNGSCSTVQSGSISQYRWDINGPNGNNTLYGRNLTTTFTDSGVYQITLTITSTGPTLTDSATYFVFLSDPGDPL